MSSAKSLCCIGGVPRYCRSNIPHRTSLTHMRSRNRFNVSGFLPAVGAGLVFFAGRALALDVNLLINTNFSENSGQSVPTSWTFFR